MRECRVRWQHKGVWLALRGKGFPEGFLEEATFKLRPER